MASKKQANRMWGGHYDQGPSKIMEDINESISFDHVLYSQDIRGSLAHSEMLARQQILTQAEKEAIHDGLHRIESEIEQGKMEFSTSLEDIHMHVESRLQEIIGDVAGKLHTARSRNDQVATDFKLFVRDTYDALDQRLKAVQSALLKRAAEHAETILPGFTHLQAAQPVTFGHHLLAYVEMLRRDRSRVADARKRLNECPLGAAALAGTSFPIDRHLTAELLGFDGPTRNSLDSTSDRDFAIEFLSVASLISMHLSRFAEEIVLWCSPGFRFITLSESFTTGSSIMPQKRNPDAAELVRAKTGRVYGALLSLLTVMKALPLTYSKDMQEDKEPVFDVAATLHLSLAAMEGMIKDMFINKDRMLALAGQGYATATDLADWLVQNLHIPFRKAHHITGRIVRLAEAKPCELHELKLDELQSVEPGINASIFDVLTVSKSVNSRQSFGGTSPLRVKEAISHAQKEYLK
ncbi:MAG: argininosuccinate lyase [Alphaproteobacteria bacterium]|nr:argininosuccinate lyase [Alphaproteobacteria bacterium]